MVGLDLSGSIFRHFDVGAVSVTAYTIEKGVIVARPDCVCGHSARAHMRFQPRFCVLPGCSCIDYVEKGKTMAAELGDKIDLLLHPTMPLASGVLLSRNADGTVNVADPFGEEARAEAIVVYRLL